MESSGQASFTLSSEVNAFCHILLLALYIPLSACSISGTGMDYLSDEDILSQSRKLTETGFLKVRKLDKRCRSAIDFRSICTRTAMRQCATEGGEAPRLSAGDAFAQASVPRAGGALPATRRCWDW